MPAEYRCDGACKRILSEYYGGDITVEGTRQYCAEDYLILTRARSEFARIVSGIVDNALLSFTHSTVGFLSPPLLQSTALQAVITKLTAVPSTTDVPVIIPKKPPKP